MYALCRMPHPARSRRLRSSRRPECRFFCPPPVAQSAVQCSPAACLQRDTKPEQRFLKPCGGVRSVATPNAGVIMRNMAGRFAKYQACRFPAHESLFCGMIPVPASPDFPIPGCSIRPKSAFGGGPGVTPVLSPWPFIKMELSQNVQ